MPSAAEVGAAYHAQQSRTAAAVTIGAVGAWRQIDGKNLDLSWPPVLARLLAIVTAGQRKAAESAQAYVGAVLRAQGALPAPGHSLGLDPFGGIASDGRTLAGLLYQPVAESKYLMSQGARIEQALPQAGTHLALLVRTQAQDAGRMAVQTVMADDATVRGYVRQVHLPACARCIILAGRFYRYSSGFQRHPNCDCTMIPAAGEHYVEAQDPDKLIATMRADHPAKLRQSLTGADLKSLDHGANLNQVVNAHRGMATAAGPGRTIATTTEGTTRRGIAGRKLAAVSGTRIVSTHQRLTASGVTTVSLRGARAPRLTPAQIFAEADANSWDRAEIVRQLSRFGYLI